MRPGWTVYVEPGRYAGFRLTRSGSAAAPVRFVGPSGARRPVIAGAAKHPYVVQLNGVRDVVLDHLAIQGAPQRWGAGVEISRGRDLLLDRLVLSHNRSFGAEVVNSANVTISASRISGNETGIQLSGRAHGVKIEGNAIFDNARMIINDKAPNNDRGANGIVFYHTVGPVLVTGNRLWGNRARSIDFGYDGGAFEIFGARDVQIERNRAFNNDDVMETGTDGPPCANDTFSDNIAYGGRGRRGPAQGLILRCASGMQVKCNRFADLDGFVFDVTAAASSFGGSIAHLRIARNIAWSGGPQIFSIDSPLPSSVVIDRDVLYNAAGRELAYVAGRGHTPRLATFRAWTGYEQRGRGFDPRFVNAAAGDLRLQARSRAAGVVACR